MKAHADLAAYLEKLTLSGNAATPLRLLVLVGGCLNGFAVRISEAWHVDGLGSMFLGLSPFELITLFVAASLVAKGEEPTITGDHACFGVPEILASVAFLIPSSAVSWLVVGTYAAYHAAESRGNRQFGFLLFLGLAVTAVWSSVVLKVLGPSITSLEAAFVGFLLSFFKDGVLQSGNVVGVPQDFTLVVMTACSTADGVPKTLLGLVSILCLAGVLTTKRFWWAGAVLISAYAIANFARLTIMASSQDLYSLAHSPIGAGIFDALIILIVFALTLGGDDK